MTNKSYDWETNPKRTGRWHCTPEPGTCHNCGKRRQVLQHAWYPWAECRPCTDGAQPDNLGRCMECNEVQPWRDDDGWCEECGGERS